MRREEHRPPWGSCTTWPLMQKNMYEGLGSEDWVSAHKLISSSRVRVRWPDMPRRPPRPAPCSGHHLWRMLCLINESVVMSSWQSVCQRSWCLSNRQSAHSFHSGKTPPFANALWPQAKVRVVEPNSSFDSDAGFSISWRWTAVWVANSCCMCDKMMHVCVCGARVCVCVCVHSITADRGGKKPTVLTQEGIDLCPVATHPYSQQKMVLIKCHLPNNHMARTGLKPGCAQNVSTLMERAGVK